ncbi:MAG: hypothetical protein AAB348_03525 [Patescibacteria group bacterium]
MHNEYKKTGDQNDTRVFFPLNKLCGSIPSLLEVVEDKLIKIFLHEQIGEINRLLNKIKKSREKINHGVVVDGLGRQIEEAIERVYTVRERLVGEEFGKINIEIGKIESYLRKLPVDNI